MNRRAWTRSAWAIALAVLAVLLGVSSACGEGESPPAAPTELTGTIDEVHARGRDVRSFSLRSEGELVEISIADDVDYGFDLNHLREHVATGDPVRCTVEERGGRLYALSIVDG